jgi:hypothetical protein
MFTRSMAAAVGVVMFAGVVHSVLAAGSDKPKPAFKMYAAFTCATYAEMAGQKEEHQRLFQLGYASGKEFLAAQRSDDPPGRNDMPVIVLLLLGGPSDDFVLGRIFSSANQSAFDKVVKYDESGIYKDAKDWIHSDEVRKMRAQTQYRRANCGLID